MGEFVGPFPALVPLRLNRLGPFVEGIEAHHTSGVVGWDCGGHHATHTKWQFVTTEFRPISPNCNTGPGDSLST